MLCTVLSISGSIIVYIIMFLPAYTFILSILKQIESNCKKEPSTNTLGETQNQGTLSKQPFISMALWIASFPFSNSIMERKENEEEEREICTSQVPFEFVTFKLLEVDTRIFRLQEYL